MATVSFNTPQPEPEKALVKAEAPQVPELASKFHSPQLEGEFSAKDVRLPRLQLGAKSGKLTDEHPEWVGQWVYDGSFPLGKSVKIVVVRLSKFYEEDLEFDSEEIPRRYTTAAEARADGATVRDVANVDVLVVVQDDGGDLVGAAAFVENGAAYLPARYTVRSTAYGQTVGILLKDWAGWLKQDLASGYYQVSSSKRSNAKNSWFVPELKTAGKVEASVREQIRTKFEV